MMVCSPTRATPFPEDEFHVSARPELRSRTSTRSRRRLALAVTLAALVPAIAVPTVLGARSIADGSVQPITHVPADQPQFGLRYAGLTPAKKGEPCVGEYRVGDASTCSHGPDAPPPGLVVTQDVPPVAKAAPEPVVPVRDTAAAPSESDVAETNVVAGSPAVLADTDAGTSKAADTTGVLCDGDGVSGKRVQVLYVRGTDTASRFAQYLESFRTWAAGVDAIYDASAQETGGSRHVRFVTTADCQVDVREVEVPATAIGTFDGTITALKNLGYNRTDRKYMVFAESKVYCGIGSFAGDDHTGTRNRSNGGPSYGRSDSGCWAPSVAAHELGHNLGAVNDSAPNSSKAGHCLDEYDVMCYNDSGGLKTHVVCTDRAHDQRLDCNHDDYYNTNPSPGSYLATHWNVADNEFLIRGGTVSPPPPAPSASAGTQPTPSATAKPSQGPTPGPTASAGPSAGASATTPGGTTATPTPSTTVPPGGSLRALQASDVTTNSVRLSWPAAVANTRYAVQLDDRVLGTVTATAVRVTGMRPDTEYRFQIATVAADGTRILYTRVTAVRTESAAAIGSAKRLVLSNAMAGVAELFGARSADGTPVVLGRRDGAANQQWTLEPAGDGYLLRSPATGKCLAPASGVDTVGTPVVQYACDPHSAAQIWRLTTTPYGTTLQTAGELVLGVGGARFGERRLLELQRPSGLRYQSWTTQAV
jgi:limonene-1,2-epoxide hydrolase